ncbi:MAG: RsmB/NOP family class I SAM-dependent RNA methyltransferase [Nitrososphaerota archaeon]|nr:RsmB/NOP family class I SAM-dependent RNA methyltransferase [Nitrososphaerota archaeon]
MTPFTGLGVGVGDLRLSEELSELLASIPDMEVDAYVEASSRPLPETFRVNTLKMSEERCVELLREMGWRFERLPWARHAYRLTGGATGLGGTLAHSLGVVYVQGPISMVPVEALDPKPGERVLDVCAAPGSKSTQIAQLMENKGVLVANDASSERIKPLIANLQRWGAYNCVVTMKDGRFFGRRTRNFFDRVLCDVPCSSLGVVMKDWSSAGTYSHRRSERLARLQLTLLLSSFDASTPGGYTVYSTCTVHPLENEAVVSEFLSQRPEAEVVEFRLEGLKGRRPLEEWKGEVFDPRVSLCFKCYPQDNGAEGFFVALLRKVR